jgi:hypothetical protein
MYETKEIIHGFISKLRKNNSIAVSLRHAAAYLTTSVPPYIHRFLHSPRSVTTFSKTEFDVTSVLFVSATEEERSDISYTHVPLCKTAVVLTDFNQT